VCAILYITVRKEGNKMIRCIAGFLLIIGAVGAQDFWDQCYAAADCVAGAPIPLTQTMGLVLLGAALIVWGGEKALDKLNG
jgi:hypothetical protein